MIIIFEINKLILLSLIIFRISYTKIDFVVVLLTIGKM